MFYIIDTYIYFIIEYNAEKIFQRFVQYVISNEKSTSRDYADNFLIFVLSGPVFNTPCVQEMEIGSRDS